MAKYDGATKALINLQKLMQQTPSFVAREMLIVANDYTAISKKRIQNQGLDEKEEIFGIYADKTQAKKEAKKHTQRPYPRINFTDTGAMFRNTRPIVTRSTTDEVVITIAPTNQDEIDKMAFNQQRFGRIMYPTKREILLIRKGVKTRIDKLFKKFNLL